MGQATCGSFRSRHCWQRTSAGAVVFHCARRERVLLRDILRFGTATVSLLLRVDRRDGVLQRSPSRVDSLVLVVGVVGEPRPQGRAEAAAVLTHTVWSGSASTSASGNWLRSSGPDQPRRLVLVASFARSTSDSEQLLHVRADLTVDRIAQQRTRDVRAAHSSGTSTPSSTDSTTVEVEPSRSRSRTSSRRDRAAVARSATHYSSPRAASARMYEHYRGAGSRWRSVEAAC